jgi:anaerobic dimethyl sulfoxide reductase subunit A
MNKAIEPLFDVRSDRDICRDLALRLGIQDPFWDLPEQDAIKLLVESMEDVIPEVGDYEQFQRNGVHKIKRPGPVICFKDQIEDPDSKHFPTLSGKIEIYSQLIADLNNPDIPSIPKHIDAWESSEDPLSSKYPLQLLTFHHKTRAHSCFDTNPWLRDLEPQSLWISKKDAQFRGVSNGDKVRVFNNRGETIVQAKVTERIMPGVVALGEGAWYRPDEKGRDRSGSPNILSRDQYSPAGAFPFNTSLVQVGKFVSGSSSLD